MNDNDTKEKVYTGVRAANTVSTLKPKDIYETAGDVPIPLSEQIKNFFRTPDPHSTAVQNDELGGRNLWTALKEAQDQVDADSGVSTLPEATTARRLVRPHFGPIGNLVSTPPKPAEQKPMDERVLRLEELVDSILDRIALYNTKSSHKL